MSFKYQNKLKSDILIRLSNLIKFAGGSDVKVKFMRIKCSEHIGSLTDFFLAWQVTAVLTQQVAAVARLHEN